VLTVAEARAELVVTAEVFASDQPINMPSLRVKLSIVPCTVGFDMAKPTELIDSFSSLALGRTSIKAASAGFFAYQVALQLPAPPVVSSTTRISMAPPD
jgi:hypothetical protein